MDQTTQINFLKQDDNGEYIVGKKESNSLDIL